MTTEEWTVKCDELVLQHDAAKRRLFLTLSHEYAHPNCADEDPDTVLNATADLVASWHEMWEYFEREPKEEKKQPILRLVE